MTQQCFKDKADINNILNQHQFKAGIWGANDGVLISTVRCNSAPNNKREAKE